MNWLSKIFAKKKETEISDEEKKQSKKKLEGLMAFEKGQEYFFNQQMNEALVLFDRAIECGFVENYTYDAGKLYEYRGGCLDGLEFHYDAIDDYDKSILLDPYDCNKYLLRSVTKGWIMDYEGEIADLKKAIEVSKVDNELNRDYNDEAQMKGYKKISDMYQMRILQAEISLKSETEAKKRVENAKPEDKAFWQKMINDRREKRLNSIKRYRAETSK